MLITFEGIDGSGKSTQIEMLHRRLRERNVPVHVFREPGGTRLSEKIRSLLLDSEKPMDAVTELMLFSAARSHLVSEEVLPRLEREEVVILDRFYDSTTSYQGYGHESISVEKIKQVNKLAGHHLVPAFTFYLRISLEAARKRTEGDNKDRMERQKAEFYERVIKGFDDLAREEERFVTLDADQPKDTIHEKIWSNIAPPLKLNRT